MVENKIIAIIPARGGSTRIPYKNIIDFMGKPLLAWNLEKAKKIKEIDRIVVSTDDEKIKKVAQDYNVEVPFLRDKYADNASSCALVGLYAAKQAEKYYNEKYKTIMILQTTCPLVSVDDIRNSLNFYLKNNIKALITATRYTMNPWWGATLDENNKPDFVLYSPEQYSSQSKPPMFCPNGAITIVDKKYLEEKQSIYTDDLRFYEMDWKNSVDIDNYEDIEMAQIMYQVIEKDKNK